AAQGFANLGEWNAERLQPTRIDHDTILFYKAADAGDLRDAFRFGDAVADIQVLDGAQLGKASLRPAYDILVGPSHTGRIRPEARCHPCRQPPRSGAKIFEHA